VDGGKEAQGFPSMSIFTSFRRGTGEKFKKREIRPSRQGNAEWEKATQKWRPGQASYCQAVVKNSLGRRKGNQSAGGDCTR